MTAISKRQRALFYIYKNKIKFKTILYVQKARHFSKSKTLPVTFLYTKSETLYVTRFFMKFLKLAFIYKKHESLRYVTFLYTKIQKLLKKKDNLRYGFIYKNPDTLRYVIFHWIFEFGGGGRYFYKQKTMHFALHFYMQKTLKFALRFRTKSLTLYKKQENLRYVFIYKNLDTLRYVIFYWIFEIGGGGGRIFICKKMHFALHFYTQKNALCVTFLYTKSLTERHYDRGQYTLLACMKLWPKNPAWNLRPKYKMRCYGIS